MAARPGTHKTRSTNRGPRTEGHVPLIHSNKPEQLKQLHLEPRQIALVLTVGLNDARRHPSRSIIQRATTPSGGRGVRAPVGKYRLRL